MSTSSGQILIDCNKDLSVRRRQILIAFNKDLSVRRAPFLSFVLMKLLWKTNIFVHYTKVEKARTNEKRLLTMQQFIQVKVVYQLHVHTQNRVMAHFMWAVLIILANLLVQTVSTYCSFFRWCEVQSENIQTYLVNLEDFL